MSRLLYKIRRSASSAHELAHGSARTEKRRSATGIVVRDREKTETGEKLTADRTEVEPRAEHHIRVVSDGISSQSGR
jgi:hypothetical protein